MEEEYRMQKAQVDISAVVEGREQPAVNGSVSDSGITLEKSSGSKDGGADDDASTRAVVSPAPTARNLEPDAGGPVIPTIRISTESDREGPVDGQLNGKTDGVAEGAAAAAGETLGKPEQAATQGEEGDDASGEPATPNGGEAFSFSNKRLCERWLDNLFMVLYEVRVSGGRMFVYSDSDLGPAHMDDLPRRSGALQDAARRLSENGCGVGDSGRSRFKAAP